jgi:hypothetical protein
MIHAEGVKVLVHRITVDNTNRTRHYVIKWCGSYWADLELGHISGPWCTLENAIRYTRAGELHAGASHDLFCLAIEPQVLASIMTAVGGGSPREVTINGQRWVSGHESAE